ncbi:MAG: triphosphoribosyl-dephospho-CoA synthase CitG [Pelosinus sp.]|nr:triphosphoribosyl-dephospho-CoA synthase CitG [Pelosinus sp.]
MEKALQLSDILAAKEARACRQGEMRAEYNLPLISITINMPGNRKDTIYTRQLVDYAVRQISQNMDIVAMRRINPGTGPECLLAVSGIAQEIKSHTVQIEEAQPFGRLLDLDVFAAEGTQLSRAEQGILRKCLVCGGPAVDCMRTRRHSGEDLAKAVQILIDNFCAYLTREISIDGQKIGALAVEAMLYEAACTPAPGLVDRANSGAHQDMNYYSFLSSSAALEFSLTRCAEAGLRHNGQSADILPVLRYIGMEGEAAMLKATGGVNTQKGLLFSLGVIAAAAGYIKAKHMRLTGETICEAVAQITEGIVERELGNIEKPIEKLTAGEKLYRRFGITGIRGEMAAGLPGIRQFALPALKRALAAGLSTNAAMVHTLLVLMACVEDTTVMNRHSPDKMRVFVKQKAEAVLKAGGMYTKVGQAEVKALDAEFIASNVSPGGAADMVAATWFIYKLEQVV